MTTSSPAFSDTAQIPRTQALPGAPGRLRLRTLIRLRWFAIAGQATAVYVVDFVLGFELPLVLCLLAIAASIVVNLSLLVAYPAAKLLSDRQASYYLAFDISQLAVLLYLTGGVENPFTILFLAPVTISAATLNVRHTIMLGALACALVSVLAVYHFPLPWRADDSLRLPATYLLGLWTALLLGIGFTAAFAWRVAVEGRRMSDALAAAQLVLAHEQQLTALGGLAAAAAHELGTPLATIQLVANELKRDLPENSPYAEDIELINSQAIRCRDILGQLTMRQDAEDAVYSRQSLRHLMDEIIERYAGTSVEIAVHSDGEGPEPEIWRQPEIIHGLGCFLQNAGDFAHSQVLALLSWSPTTITISFYDDGPGFTPDILSRLGEPYVTTRPRVTTRSRSSKNRDRQGRADEGLGLGFFIAKTLLEHTGGVVVYGNANQLSLTPSKPPKYEHICGAVVSVSWPRHLIESSKTGAQRAAVDEQKGAAEE